MKEARVNTVHSKDPSSTPPFLYTGSSGSPLKYSPPFTVLPVVGNLDNPVRDP
jgi:hypothetical protein